MIQLVIGTLWAPWHMVVILFVVLLLFGGQKLPELMGGLGKGMKEFKKAMHEAEDEKPAEKPKEVTKAGGVKNEPLKE